MSWRDWSAPRMLKLTFAFRLTSPAMSPSAEDHVAVGDEAVPSASADAQNRGHERESVEALAGAAPERARSDERRLAVHGILERHVAPRAAISARAIERDADSGAFRDGIAGGVRDARAAGSDPARVEIDEFHESVASVPWMVSESSTFVPSQKGTIWIDSGSCLSLGTSAPAPMTCALDDVSTCFS